MKKALILTLLFGIGIFSLLHLTKTTFAQLTTDQLRANADINRDGRVSLADFEILRTYFGQTIDSTVPNPTSTPLVSPTVSASQLPKTVTAPDPEKDHWRGSKQASVVMIEFVDFQCPFCKKFVPTLNTVLSENQGDLALVFRHFPLSFHPMAFISAEASECAAAQGGNDAFWRFHDAIFAAMPNISSASQLTTIASQIGLNGTTFTNCLNARTYKSVVDAAVNNAKEIGINATPTTLLYNRSTGETKEINGALPLSTVRQIVKDFIGN